MNAASVATGLAGRFRLALWVAIAAAICALSIRYHFPGYFDPFAVFHTDHFIYAGMQYEGEGLFYSFGRYLLYYPRPIGFLLLHYAGKLGVTWQLAPVFACFVLNAALLARYIERLTRRVSPVPAFVLFAALIFANPEFYWGIKLDPLAVYSLSFLLVGAHAWQNYVETERMGYLPLTALLMIGGALSKEAYFVVIGLFWLAQILWSPRHRLAAVMMLAASGVGIGIGAYRAIGWTRSSGSAYESGIGPLALMRGLWVFGRVLFFPALLAALGAIAAAAWRRDRNVTWITVACVVLGVASLLPNATLRNHLYNHYAFLGLLFASAPVLLVGRIVPRRAGWYAGVTALGLITYAVFLREQRSNIAATAGRIREMENVTRRLLPALERVNAQVSSGESVLVAGMTGQFNPFFVPPYIKGVMCSDCRWTVVVPASTEESMDTLVGTVHTTNERIFDGYDRLVVIAPDGSLAAIYKNPRMPLRQHAARETSSERGSIRFVAIPNPAPTGSGGNATTTIHWTMPEGRNAEIRAGAPGGPLLARGSMGNVEIREGVSDGTVFFLQDTSQGESTLPEHTAAIIVMSVDGPNTAR